MAYDDKRGVGNDGFCLQWCWLGWSGVVQVEGVGLLRSGVMMEWGYDMGELKMRFILG